MAIACRPAWVTAALGSRAGLRLQRIPRGSVTPLFLDVLQAALYGIQPLDPVSFATAPAALVVVALVACAIPARRAAAIDPADALRRE